MQLNTPAHNEHLFSYMSRGAKRPLTKSKFIARIMAAACSAGLKLLQGHGIRIGSTLEYLLRGIPFEVVKTKGRWASDAFQLYLTKHAQIMAPYIQANSELQVALLRITLPPIR